MLRRCIHLDVLPDPHTGRQRIVYAWRVVAWYSECMCVDAALYEKYLSLIGIGAALGRYAHTQLSTIREANQVAFCDA